MSTSESAPENTHTATASINHIGITVPDIESAAQWYCDVFGFALMGPVATASIDSPFGDFRRAVFGDRWSKMRQARLLDSQGVGLELFQFDVPATVSLDDNFTYWMVGPHHLSVTVDDTPAKVEQVLRSGGRLRGNVATIGDARVAYCSDPWGNTLELCDQSFRDLAAVVAPTA